MDGDPSRRSEKLNQVGSEWNAISAEGNGFSGMKYKISDGLRDWKTPPIIKWGPNPRAEEGSFQESSQVGN